MNNLHKLLTRPQYYALVLCANFLLGCSQEAVVTESVSNAQLPPSVKTKLEQAKASDSFVNAIGVNTHLMFTDSAYGRYDDLIKPKLQELGVRHIRDGGPPHDQVFWSKIQDLGRVGIKTTLTFFGDPIPQVIANVNKTKGAVEAIEGPNETDLDQFNFSYNSKKFPEGTRLYQQKLYTAIKGNPTTKSLPVLMPSMGWGENAQKLGLLKWGDFGNMHSYPGLANPPTDGLDWYYIPHARKIAGKTKPLWVTETGYHNSLGDNAGISEQASGKYLPRLLLENFNRNIQRVYLYEFINQHPDTNSDGQKNFGLLRYDGSPKPAFTAIKNMISLLKDPGAKFGLKSLNYSLSGNTNDVHRTLLQKRDGNFYLVLWQEAKSWDNEKKKDAAIANRTLTLNLNTPISQVVAYQPLKSASPLKRYTNPNGRVKQLQISVPDHPLVLRLVASGKK